MTSESHPADFTEPAEPDDPFSGNGSEDDVVAAARARAAELRCSAIGPSAAAMLRFLTGALRAKAVVEVGTGAGVSGLHLLSGMPGEGVLTSIDIEAQRQRQARRGFADAGFAPSRTRLITGEALEVLPRFTAGGYDLVFIDAAPVEYPQYFEQSVPLLRPGAVIAFHHDGDTYPGDNASPGRPATRALRELARTVRHDERLVSVSLSRDTGLLLATLTHPR